MIEIRRLLVGLELHPKRAELTTGSRNACVQAIWLAKELGAEILFLHSTWRDGDEGPEADPGARLSEHGRGVFDELLSELEDEGVPARLEVTGERPWFAIIHAALRGDVDLVLVGKRDEMTTEGRRLGSVATKLLRKCPAPVWVVKPEHDLVHRLVLAATDLTPVGDRAVRFGGFVAGRSKCVLHVVHAYQIPMSLQLSASRISEEAYAAEIDAIKSQAQSHIDAAITESAFDGESIVHIGRNAAYLAIREAVEHLHPDLLVLGTVSRGGLPGLLLGNTAERLLDRVDCSILTVKPADFVCPVVLPEA